MSRGQNLFSQGRLMVLSLFLWVVPGQIVRGSMVIRGMIPQPRLFLGSDCQLAIEAESRLSGVAIFTVLG